MYLAIDIGGTKTLIALFSRGGRVVRRMKFKTSQSREKFLRDLTKNLNNFVGRKVRAITCAVPGHVRVEQNICSVRFGNREAWGWFDLSTSIKNLFNCPLYFENDANLAAIYESKGLSGKTMFLTFSTGIGGGLAENGNLLLNDGDKFEPGHKKYIYNSVEREWEDIAAASALEKAYHIDQATDLRGREAMEDVAARMALGLRDLVAEYHPDTVVIGGPMGRIFKKYVKYLPDLKVKYQRPKRPLESVIYGCYLFSKSQA